MDYCAFLQFLLIRLSVEAINLPLRDWADFGKLHDSAISNLKSLPHQRYTYEKICTSHAIAASASIKDSDERAFLHSYPSPRDFMSQYKKQRTPSSLPLQPEIGRKKQISVIKFLLSCFLLFPGITAVVGLIAIANQASQLVSFSHRYLYQNQTLDAVTNRSLVVQPLIDNDQTFDLVVTIRRQLSRKEMSDQHASWRSNRKAAASATPANTTSFANTTSAAVAPMGHFFAEKAVFSNTVFKGLRLRDMHIFQDVNFSIPTELL